MMIKFFRIRAGKAAKTSHGFTLIEILVVLTILGLMAALVVPNVISKLRSSKDKTARIQIAHLEEAVEMYYLDMGNYPPNLTALIQGGPPPWDGPYLKSRDKTIPKDPWGDEYAYQITDGGKSFSITSSHLKDSANH